MLWRWRERRRGGSEEHTNLGTGLILAEGRGVEAHINGNLANRLESVFPVKGQAGERSNQKDGKIQCVSTGDAPVHKDRGPPTTLLIRRCDQGSQICEEQCQFRKYLGLSEERTSLQES